MDVHLKVICNFKIQFEVITKGRCTKPFLNNGYMEYATGENHPQNRTLTPPLKTPLYPYPNSINTPTLFPIRNPTGVAWNV